jgi:ribosomal protein S27E
MGGVARSQDGYHLRPTSTPSSSTSSVDGFTIAVHCPGCGSGIDFVEGVTTVACAHCGMSHIIFGTGGIKRFYIPRRASRSAAVASVKKLVEKSLADEGQRMAVRMIDAKLVYVPFFRVKLRGGGWYIAHETTAAPKSVGVDENGQPIYIHPVKKKTNGVFVKEGTYFSPAIDISDLGKFGISTKSSVLKLHILKDEDQKTRGMFFDPVKDPEAAVREAWSMLVGAARPTDVTLDYFEAEKISEELSQIYHPLWIVRFLLGEHAVRVVVDGVSGEIVRARIPIRSRVNLLPGVLISGTTAFLIAALKQFFVPLLLLGAFIFFLLPDRSRITRFFYKHIVKPWDDGEVVIE